MMPDQQTEQQTEQQTLDLDIDAERSAVVEALLFARGEPEDVGVLASALGWSKAEVSRALDELEHDLSAGRRGIMLQRDGQHVQLVTAPRFGALVERMLRIERTVRLSPAALETLAIIAYRQPVTRPEIEAVRGVDCSGVLANLVARDLIEIVGTRSALGNPREFGTTAAFLAFFGLSSLDDLPPAGE